MLIKNTIYALALVVACWASPPFAALTPNVDTEVNLLKKKAKDINDQVLKLALIAYHHANQQGLIHNKKLTVIDYSKSSGQPRLWVFDIQQHTLNYQDYVTHGKNSGFKDARSFSNQLGSHKSSIGTFLTRTAYVGQEGYSLHLKGLEAGINDNAEKRSIVVHGARYASAAVAKRFGRLGRSWGCFAVAKEHARALIDTIKDGSILFAYYPDSFWLHTSHFLH